METLLERYLTDAVNGLPLIAVVFLCVEVAKKFGAKGNLLLGISFAFGLVIGGCFMYAQAVPASFAEWFGLVIYGLGLGGITSLGLYDGLKGMTQRATVKAITEIEEKAVLSMGQDDQKVG
jgi:hypothetical protein